MAKPPRKFLNNFHKKRFALTNKLESKEPKFTAEEAITQYHRIKFWSHRAKPGQLRESQGKEENGKVE